MKQAEQKEEIIALKDMKVGMTVRFLSVDPSHSHWKYTEGKTYPVVSVGRSVGPVSEGGSIPLKDWGFKFSLVAARNAEAGPLQWRDRIREIDTTVEALEEERASLVQHLEDEGFKLLDQVDAKIAEAEQAHEGMSDWRNWRVGDHLEVVERRHGHKFEIGKIVRLTREPDTRGECAICEYVDSRDRWALHASELKFHSRPTA